MRSGELGRMWGEIEVDETFIGGKAQNMHEDKREREIKGRGAIGKAAVIGFLRRGGEVRAQVTPNRRKHTLETIVRNHVAPNSVVYTDALPSYEDLDNEYIHEMVDHAVEYVRGRVHTNGLENFWSLLKRGIKGTYVSVEPFHLERYLDEQTFRYNNRDNEEIGDAGRFRAALAQTVGKRLTYDELTGKAALEKQKHILN